MKTKLIAVALIATTALIGCKKDEATTTPVTTSTTTSTATKPTVTTFKFASNGKDCSIIDGFANQQHALPYLVHINTDKCNGESFRPTITLNFDNNTTTLAAGTYTVTTGTPTANQVKISSDQYNYTNWQGTSGTVVVTQNATDSSLIDIELKSITMTNLKNTSDTTNPDTDVLTGFIIKI